MIVFDSVTKKFGASLALEDISLEVKQGEFVFIVGPSGAGKSTLLRILTREVLPTSGKVLVGEKDIIKMQDKDIPGLRRKVGVVFQDFKLLDDRTVFEQVALALEVLGKRDDEILKAVYFEDPDKWDLQKGVTPIIEEQYLSAHNLINKSYRRHIFAYSELNSNASFYLINGGIVEIG